MEKNIQKGQIDLYCAFIASRYFNTIEDFINFEMINSYFYGNMTKFHYNPISLNKKTLTFFPNVETLHLYDEDDEYLTGQRIQWYVDWKTPIGWYENKERKQSNEDKTIEYKRIVYTQKDAAKDIQKFEKITDEKYKTKTHHYIIPNGVKEIEMKCFEQLNSRLVSNNGFNLSDDLLQLQEICLQSISLPSTIVSLGDRCFANCRYLTRIEGLKYVKNFGRNVFLNVKYIKDPKDNEIIYQLERKDIETMITSKQLQKLEFWVQRKVERVIFDWTEESMGRKLIKILPDWYGPNSHYSHHYFIMQTEDDIVFGGYSDFYFPNCSSFFGPEFGYVSDENAFVFTLRNKQPQKYSILFPQNALEIDSFEESDYLAFGLNDFYVSFLEHIPSSCCQDKYSSYDYGGTENALLGYTGRFKLKRMILLKMTDKQFDIPDVIVDDIELKSQSKGKDNKQSCCLL